MVARLPWIQDGVNGRETGAIGSIKGMADVDPRLLRVVDIPWFTDGLTEWEADALLYLSQIGTIDSEYAHRLLSHPWLMGKVGHSEQDVLDTLLLLGYRDRQLLNGVINGPTLMSSKDMSFHHGEWLNALSIVAGREPSLAARLLELSPVTFTQRSRRDADLALALGHLATEQEDAFEQLIGQGWFADGLSDEEIALVITLPRVAEISSDLYRSMVHSWVAQSASVDLPGTGTVDLWAFQESGLPRSEGLMADLERAIRAMDEFMEIPFPVSVVIVLIVSSDALAEYEIAGGLNHGSHIEVRQTSAGKVSESILFHELGHYYITFFPVWIIEGTAEFLSALVRGPEGFHERKKSLEGYVEEHCYAKGIENLNQLNLKEGFYLDMPSTCTYALGEYFFIAMFEAVGPDALASALADLYTLVESTEDRLSNLDIYQAMYRHTAPERIQEFVDVYRRLHGGPLAVSVESNTPDDHGDGPSEAASIVLSQVVGGAMDHALDADYFEFEAEAGRKYNITLAYSAESALRVTLHLPGEGAPQRLVKNGHVPGTLGVRVPWVVPTSGVYYLAVDSGEGATGEYTLAITPAMAAPDDHGEGPANATNISVGQTVTGSLDYESDTDFFKVQVETGTTYRIQGESHHFKVGRLRVLGTDGRMEASDIVALEIDLGYKWRFQGEPEESGLYYLVIDDLRGRIGGYTFSIGTIAAPMDDHGDDASSATVLPLGEIVQGSIERPFDKDYFHLDVEVGRQYNILLNHISIPYQPVTLFATDRVTPVLEYSPTDGRPFKGSFIPWVPTGSADYFLLFRSPDNDLGDYTLAVYPAIAGSDDHGDAVAEATRMEVDELVPGVLDREGDVDYFRFMAAAGLEYDISADYGSLDDARLSLYGLDGVTPESSFVGRGREGQQDTIRWIAPASGEYHVVVWRPSGEVGAYTLEVGQST